MESKYLKAKHEKCRDTEKRYLEIAKDNPEYPSDNVITAKLMFLEIAQNDDPEYFTRESVRIIKALSERIAKICNEEIEWGRMALYGNVIKLLGKSLDLGEGFVFNYDDVNNMFIDIGFQRDVYWNDPEVMVIMFPELKEIVEKHEIKE